MRINTENKSRQSHSHPFDAFDMVRSKGSAMGAEPDLRQEEKSEGWRLKERKAHEKKNNELFLFFLT